MSPGERQDIQDAMHRIELRLSTQITRVEVKLDGEREAYNDIKKDVDNLESRYNKLLMLVITLLLAGIINLAIQYAGSK